MALGGVKVKREKTRAKGHRISWPGSITYKIKT